MPEIPEEARRSPAELIEAALRQSMRVCAGVPMSGAEAGYAAQIAVDALTKAGMVVVPAEDHQAALGLLEEFADPDECWFDHDGGCQAHGPTSTWPRCPHAHARELLAALPERTDHA